MSYTQGSFLRATTVLIATMLGGSLAGHPRAFAGQQSPVAPTDQELHYKCDTEGVRLEGTLTERTFYGPPGFGETPKKDLRDKVLVLKLTKPITVEPTENAEAKGSTSLNTLRHVHQIQLFLDSAQTAEGRKLAGKTVVVAGTLEEATAPRQYTDVSMDVKTITQ